MKLPKARTENLLEQNLEKETLLYDLTIDKAFNLNETLTIVYQACGQSLTCDELKRKHQFTDDFIFLALDELKRNNLLAESFDSPFANTNRREVIKKVGLATMFALPIITGLIAPKAVNAASGQTNNLNGAGEYCSNASTCQPGLVCTSTYGLNDACCTVIAPVVVLSGNSYATGESAPVYDLIPADAPLEDPNACQNMIYCCDGSTPVGGCTYTPVSDVEYDGKLLVLQTCNCTCP